LAGVFTTRVAINECEYDIGAQLNLTIAAPPISSIEIRVYLLPPAFTDTGLIATAAAAVSVFF